MIAADLSKASIAKVRVENFGKLYVRIPEPEETVSRAEFDELSDTLKKLLQIIVDIGFDEAKHLLPAA